MTPATANTEKANKSKFFVLSDIPGSIIKSPEKLQFGLRKTRFHLNPKLNSHQKNIKICNLEVARRNLGPRPNARVSQATWLLVAKRLYWLFSKENKILRNSLLPIV